MCFTSFRRQEIPPDQNCIGLVRFCSIGSKIELTAKQMFEVVRLPNPVEHQSFDWIQREKGKKQYSNFKFYTWYHGTTRKGKQSTDEGPVPEMCGNLTLACNAGVFLERKHWIIRRCCHLGRGSARGLERVKSDLKGEDDRLRNEGGGIPPTPPPSLIQICELNFLFSAPQWTTPALQANLTPTLALWQHWTPFNIYCRQVHAAYEVFELPNVNITTLPVYIKYQFKLYLLLSAYLTLL